MTGRLTTHVLDITSGAPAVGVGIELWQFVDAGDGTRLSQERTNADGRTDAPLLEGETMLTGVYELVFVVGEYFAGRGTGGSEPPFLDRVPVRFGIADPAAHYHVPLLVSPWAYSTYRGS
jgi:5-hydroxyisourate hydrolase